MKLFFVYGVDQSDGYPLIKLYGVFSSRDRALKFIRKQRLNRENGGEKFCFKACALDEPWKSDLHIPKTIKG